ncbi:conserved unknown protein [Ectocarpus siliculosus]|uniref:Uncharacterized protein n=1 Tax=Ectocarpus siliculosus TaxID=2880 RepID=D7G2R4_ECTSI|nr:conserved unknown protein [Ectocarpus siliculosus]|eukprot:CBJ26889.1 conserved unknown protein [Ectocarpus siliculosus]
MNEEQFESVEQEGVCDDIPDLDWLLSAPPEPINISSFNGPTVLAILVISATALVVDFAKFRAAELKSTGRSDPAAAPQERGREHAQVPNGLDGHGGDGGGGAVAPPERLSRASGSSAENRVHRKRACVLAWWIVGALICHRLGSMTLARVFATIGSLVACLPHLLRSSKYRRDRGLGCLLETGDKRRPLTDMLVWTSFVYCLPSVYGLYAHQYGIAGLQLMTTIGSTLFHLTRETKFFNLDNVFATSLLSTTAWSLYLGVTHGVWWYVVVIGLGGPFAIFCIVRCGMPGLVCRHPAGSGLCRRSNPEYDFFHMLWHLSSGLGTLITIHFFEVYFPAEEAGGGWFYFFPDVPVVPTVALALSALINLYGNRVGVMPLE